MGVVQNLRHYGRSALPLRFSDAPPQGSRDRASLMKNYLAIINPAAGGGRCGKLAAGALERLRFHGLSVDVVETRQPGDATRIARENYAQGVRRFLAGGGDGTSYEIVNGLFPRDAAD